MIRCARHFGRWTYLPSTYATSLRLWGSLLLRLDGLELLGLSEVVGASDFHPEPNHSPSPHALIPATLAACVIFAWALSNGSMAFALLVAALDVPCVQPSLWQLIPAMIPPCRRIRRSL